MGIIDQFLDRVTAGPGFRPEDVALSDRLAWLNDDDGNTMESWPGPGWQDDAYEPTLEEEAEWRGYQVGLEGGLPCSPPTWPGSARIRYATGRQRGLREREDRETREEAEYNSWLEDMAREREEELMLEDARSWHEAERIRCLGCIETRKETGS